MSELTGQLNELIADATVIYQKLRHYHWNVNGPHFYNLHVKFEELYDETALVIDGFAERVRGLGDWPVHTMKDMLELSSLSEDPEIPDADTMVSRLSADYEAFSAKLEKALKLAEEADDRVTVDLLDETNDQVNAHIWMFKAYLGK